MRTENYIFVKIDERPDWKDIPEGTVYWIEQYHGLAFLCPCGCRAQIYLGISEQVASHPHLWQFDGVRTISALVEKKDGCKSHFHITDGKVIWS